MSSSPAAAPTSAAAAPTSAAAPATSAVNEPSSSAAATSAAEPTTSAAPATTSKAADPTTNQPTTSAAQTSQQPTSEAPTSSNNPPSSSAAAPTSSAAATTSVQPVPTTSESPSPSTNPPSSTQAQSSSPAETTTSEQQPTTTSEETPTTFVTTITSTDSTGTSIIVVTNTKTAAGGASNTASATATSTPSTIDPSGGSSTGLKTGAKVAIGVVVPIVAIGLLALAGIFFWKKRKARLAAEEERRKEVEDYSYNPNADPTMPAVGMADGGYEMREDGSSGYRGWGTTTLASSTGRKASTTMSGGGKNGYSDPSSPTQPQATLVRNEDVYSPEGEILGAMGPSATATRGAGVDRGPSNASSSYTGRSDGSDPPGAAYGAGATYYDMQNQGGYTDNPYPGQEAPAQPVIRDNPARRNTRIENTTHYPQQSAGISQNF